MSNLTMTYWIVWLILIWNSCGESIESNGSSEGSQNNSNSGSSKQSSGGILLTCTVALQVWHLSGGVDSQELHGARCAWGLATVCKKILGGDCLAGAIGRRVDGHHDLGAVAGSDLCGGGAWGAGNATHRLLLEDLPEHWACTAVASRGSWEKLHLVDTEARLSQIIGLGALRACRQRLLKRLRRWAACGLAFTLIVGLIDHELRIPGAIVSVVVCGSHGVFASGFNWHRGER